MRGGRGEPMQLAATSLLVWSEVEGVELTKDIQHGLASLNPVPVQTLDDPQETAQQEAAKAPQGSAWGGAMHDAIFGTKHRQGMIETMAKQTVRTMGSQLGRQILRGVLGGIFGGRR